MHQYFINTPWLVRKLFYQYAWRIPTHTREVFLTFDDGPHPDITPWVLDTLARANAKATFFCIGRNVQLYPEVYKRILEEGHAVGNHTQNHLNGWHTPVDEYIADVKEAAEHIKSSLFRPPYGRIRGQQFRRLKQEMKGRLKVVMWDVLTADFDTSFTPEQCLAHVTLHICPGSVVVFHDSEKAFPNMKYALEGTLEFLGKESYQCSRIEEEKGLNN